MDQIEAAKARGERARVFRAAAGAFMAGWWKRLPEALWNWLGSRGWPEGVGDFLARPWRPLAWLVVLLAILAAEVLCVVAAVLLSHVWAEMWAASDPDRINKLLLALAGIVGAPFIIWRVLIAARTNHIAQEGLYTTMLTKAVEQLGAVREEKSTEEVDDGKGGKAFVAKSKTVANTEVRLGGIYALEKLARDYEPLHWPIMEILCAYVRENAGKPRVRPHLEDLTQLGDFAAGYTKYQAALATHQKVDVISPRVDIQMALTVIGRRPEQRRKLEESESNENQNGQEFRLDLTDCHLAGAEFSGLHFERARFDRCCLENAQFSDAHFEETWLPLAKLENASLSHAHLKNAWLSGAQLEGATLIGTNLQGSMLTQSNFTGAFLSGTRLEGANFANALGLTSEMLVTTYGDAKTILPDGIARPKNARWGGAAPS